MCLTVIYEDTGRENKSKRNPSKKKTKERHGIMDQKRKKKKKRELFFFFFSTQRVLISIFCAKDHVVVSFRVILGTNAEVLEHAIRSVSQIKNMSTFITGIQLKCRN